MKVRMSNCAPLWRSAFPNQNVQSTPFWDQLWKFGCLKKLHAATARSRLPSQNRATFGRIEVEKAHTLVARRTFPRQHGEKANFPTKFETSNMKKEGRKEGKKERRKEGKKERRKEGKKERKKEGKQESRKEGKKERRKEGKKERRKEGKKVRR